jgi:hypothetical protein
MSNKAVAGGGPEDHSSDVCHSHTRRQVVSALSLPPLCWAVAPTAAPSLPPFPLPRDNAAAAPAPSSSSPRHFDRDVVKELNFIKRDSSPPSVLSPPSL